MLPGSSSPDSGPATRYRFDQERVRRAGREQTGQWLRTEGEWQQSFVGRSRSRSRSLSRKRSFSERLVDPRSAGLAAFASNRNLAKISYDSAHVVLPLSPTRLHLRRAAVHYSVHQLASLP